VKRTIVLFLVLTMVALVDVGSSIAQNEGEAVGQAPDDGGNAAPAAGASDGAADGAADGAGGGGQSFLLPMMIIFALFYFIMLRPGRRKEKDRTTRVTTIEKNMQVITRGGIIGKVVSVNEDRQEMTILTDEKTDTRLKISRSGVWDVYDPSEAEEKKK